VFHVEKDQSKLKTNLSTASDYMYITLNRLDGTPLKIRAA
jgi:hypothetical protein